MATKGSLSALGTSLADLELAAKERLLDAEALLSARRFASSIAFGLYALEIELKIAICRRLDLTQLPKVFHTHNLEELLLYTGLSNKIARVKRPKLLKSHWDTLLRLPAIDNLRYGQNVDWDEALARDTIFRLNDKISGVIPWLKKQS
jgi:hypothetical protein